MTIIIKKTDTRQEVEKKLLDLSKTRTGRKVKGFNAMKYLGKRLFGKIDGLDYQLKVRNEWH